MLGCVAFQAPFSTGGLGQGEGYALSTFCMRSAQGREEGEGVCVSCMCDRMQVCVVCVRTCG